MGAKEIPGGSVDKSLEETSLSKGDLIMKVFNLVKKKREGSLLGKGS